MTDAEVILDLSQEAQLVHERNAWAVYCGGDRPLVHLDAGQLDECLNYPERSSQVGQQLIDAGVLVPTGGEPARFERATWASRGWNAAFDLAVAFHGSDVDAVVSAGPPARIRRDASVGTVRGIREHYPAAPTASPLARESLRRCFESADLPPWSGSADIAVAAISVDDVVPGWYRPDGTPWPGAGPLPSEGELERMVPVAFGRAGFAVQAVVIVMIVDEDLMSVRARDYTRLLTKGGAVLSHIEGAASDAGISSRGNYAVDQSLGDRLGIATDHLIMIGAVALGAR